MPSNRPSDADRPDAERDTTQSPNGAVPDASASDSPPASAATPAGGSPAGGTASSDRDAVIGEQPYDDDDHDDGWDEYDDDGYGAYDEPAPLDDGHASVIEIGRNDDVASVCGSVDTAPTYAVVIYARRGNRDLGTDLGMRRLKRHADDTGKVVAIASRKSDLRHRARQAGIAYGPKPERIRWDAAGSNVVYLPFVSFRTPAVGRYGTAVGLSLALVLLVALVLTVLPKGSVTAVPAVTPVEKEVQVTGLLLGDPDSYEGIVVDTVDVSFSMDVTLTQPTTGMQPVNTVRARARVNITNPTDDDVTLPADIALISNNVTFHLAEETTVDEGETVEDVLVIAETAGAPGNVAARTITVFRDPEYADLTVINPQAATSGATEEKAVVTKEDLTALAAQQQRLLQSEGIRQAIAAQHPGMAIFASTMVVSGQQVDPLPEVGTPIDLIASVYRVSVTATAIEEDDFRDLAREELDSGAIEGEFLIDEIRALDIASGPTDASGGAIMTTMRLTGYIARNTTTSDIKSMVTGKSPGDAEAALNEALGARGNSVEVTPGLLPWLPRFGFRVDVDYELPPSVATGEDSGSDTATPTATATVAPTGTATVSP